MKHFTSSKFWRYFDTLPIDIQQHARHNYELLKQNPHHPSLQFKSVKNGAFRSVRVSLGYRALGIPVDQGVQWFWIGSPQTMINCLPDATHKADSAEY